MSASWWAGASPKKVTGYEVSLRNARLWEVHLHGACLNRAHMAIQLVALARRPQFPSIPLPPSHSILRFPGGRAITNVKTERLLQKPERREHSAQAALGPAESV